MLERRVVVVSLILACMLVLLLAAATAGAASPQYAGGQPPAISQPLIREGDLAVKLARALNMGTLDELEAENQLAAVGIAPSNGWIADYPVTPDIADEIRQAVTEAASAGMINVSADTAVESVNTILAQAGLSVEGVAGEIAADAESVEAPPGYYTTTVVNNYYNSAGPPVITYYSPPPAYTYLYGWVPYPFWCSGFWFPGFFVLHDFHRSVFIDSRPVFVSNHFHDTRRDRFIRVDAATRFRGADRTGITGVTTLPGRGAFSGNFTRDRSGHTLWRRDGDTRRSSTPFGVTSNAPASRPAATVTTGRSPGAVRNFEGTGRIIRSGGGSSSNPGGLSTPPTRHSGSLSTPSRSSRFFGVSRSEAATIPSSGMVRGSGVSSRGSIGSAPRSFSGSAPRSFTAPMGRNHSIGSTGGFSRGSGSMGGRGGGGFGGGRGRR
jgi:hypothetical protein